MPSREAKLAIRTPAVAAATPVATIDPTSSIDRGRVRTYARDAATRARSSRSGRKVRKVQDGLSANLGTTVNAAASQTSLQLALENEKLKDAQAAYLSALKALEKRAMTSSAMCSP